MKIVMNQMFRMSILSLVIVFASFLFQSCSEAKINEADLKGTWVLKNLNQEAASDAFKGNIPNLEFDFEKKTISGYSGCNRFNGAFTLEGNVFKVGNLATTQMLCLEANKEGEFIGALSTSTGLVLALENQVLSFKDGDKVILDFEMSSGAEK